MRSLGGLPLEFCSRVDRRTFTATWVGSASDGVQNRMLQHQTSLYLPPQAGVPSGWLKYPENQGFVGQKVHSLRAFALRSSGMGLDGQDKTDGVSGIGLGRFPRASGAETWIDKGLVCIQLRWVLAASVVRARDVESVGGSGVVVADNGKEGLRSPASWPCDECDGGVWVSERCPNPSLRRGTSL